jgi:hypothetical protein
MEALLLVDDGTPAGPRLFSSLGGSVVWNRAPIFLKPTFGPNETRHLNTGYASYFTSQ